METNLEIALLHRKILSINAQLRGIAKEFFIDYGNTVEPEYKNYPEYIALEVEKQELRKQMQQKMIQAGKMDSAMLAEGGRPSAADDWRAIPAPGLEHYEASNSGFIRNSRTYRVYQRRAQGKLLWISLVDSAGKIQNTRVDKLIALTWLPTKPTKHLAHLNGDTFDCRKENLKWMS